MPRSLVPEEIRSKYIQEGLTLRALGQKQQDLEYGGRTYYLDNKGNGNFSLRDRAFKYDNNGARRAAKFNATPTLADYTSAYGDSVGQQLFNQQRLLVQKLYQQANSTGKHVDHIHSLHAGGVQHPNNLRPLNPSVNITDGARVASPELKNGLLIADTVPDQIRLQGPQPSTRQRNSLLTRERRKVFQKLNGIPGMTDSLNRVDSTGSSIVDRINGSNAQTSHAETLGIPLDLF